MTFKNGERKTAQSVHSFHMCGLKVFEELKAAGPMSQDEVEEKMASPVTYLPH